MLSDLNAQAVISQSMHVWRVKSEIIKTVLFCVLKLCTVISTLR